MTDAKCLEIDKMSIACECVNVKLRGDWRSNRSFRQWVINQRPSDKILSRRGMWSETDPAGGIVLGHQVTMRPLSRPIFLVRQCGSEDWKRRWVLGQFAQDGCFKFARVLDYISCFEPPHLSQDTTMTLTLNATASSSVAGDVLAPLSYSSVENTSQLPVLSRFEGCW